MARKTRMTRMTRMARVTRMARTVARMARWLADFADPNLSRQSIIEINIDFSEYKGIVCYRIRQYRSYRYLLLTQF